MEASKRILKYQFKDGRKSLFRFWLTMIVVNILIFFLNRIGGPHANTGMSVGMPDGRSLVSIVGVNLMALLVLFIAYNYESYYKIFPIALSFSTTRRNYSLSLIAKTILMVLVSAIIQAILFKVDSFIVGMTGKEILDDFLIFNSRTDSIFYIIFALSIMFLTFSSIWNLIASLNYRFGYIFWIVYFGIYLISISTPGLREIISKMWQFIGEIFITRIDLTQTLKLSLIIIVSQVLGFLNTSNIDIRHKSA